ncbi:serine hydrolase domain-containing protein [Thermomonospora umbrina]|uniref:CubicO group peptidase (Beta-lactamase class C family) n=1 Tax=Thermomonospora umbrina TaxID=111806 RepID=A0A3D9ST88_9ACTN|nr:serine hydrolase domain-containing protein [Thermomonospora umbrina]REE99179.1 CubicO group peptidase (beta-lactamase class C family) [Thermomonospora umbrina]
MTIDETTVQGHCDPAFKTVREAFEDSFAHGRELGAALAVYADDRLVVDLWGGVADRRSGRPWLADTPCFGFSCTKAVTATAALLLAERGAYDLDGPVTDWWPEFGVHGKADVTAEHLLSHQAGLPALDGPVTAEEAADAAAMADRLAAQTPEWTPGQGHGYHPLTFGWLAGEIVRRHGGRSVGRFVRDEFAGDLDLWIGVPPDVLDRAARMSSGRHAAAKGAAPDDPVPVGADGGTVLNRLSTATGEQLDLMNRAFNNPDPGKGGYNNPVVLAAGWPGAGMVSTATALAGLYRDLVGGRVLRPDTLREGIRRRVDGPDRVTLMDSSFGLGYMRPSMVFFTPPAGQENAFGHAGAGGSVGLGDVEAGIGMAYLPNLMGTQLSGDVRAYRLIDAVYASLT